jgi:phytoene dehydrogenase-like protein
LRLDTEVADIRIRAERVSGLVLAGGEEIVARTVLSTLDVKRTFLNLIAWKMLPEPLVKRVARFRMSGGAARVLFALDAIPSFGFARETQDAARGAIHVVDSLEEMSRAHDMWRRGQLAERLPVTLRVPSLSDPSLAPTGKAVLSATLSCVPSLLFDGEWTTAKCGKLVAAALNAAEQASPGIGASVLGAQTIVAADIESALGLTDGDFDGGEVAPDQIFGFRPFSDWSDGRTPLRGLYLGGPSAGPAPFLTGVAGERAALAAIADLKGRTV